MNHDYRYRVENYLTWNSQLISRNSSMEISTRHNFKDHLNLYFKRKAIKKTLLDIAVRRIAWF